MVELFLEDEANKIESRDFLIIQQCFKHMRFLYKELERTAQSIQGGSTNLTINEDLTGKMNELEMVNSSLTEQVNALKEAIKKREEEMELLVKLLDKQKIKGSREERPDPKLEDIKNNLFGEAVPMNKIVDDGQNEEERAMAMAEVQSRHSRMTESRMSESRMSRKRLPPADLMQQLNKASSVLEGEVKLNSEVLTDQLVAYNEFKKKHLKMEVRRKNDEDYMNLIKGGKSLTEQYTKLKAEIEELKKEIGNITTKISYSRDDPELLDKLRKDESRIYDEMHPKKKQMTVWYKELVRIKQDAKRIEKMNQTLMQDIQADFNVWYDLVKRRQEYD